MASRIDGIITFCGGLYATLVGFGVLSASKDRLKNVEWLKKWGKFMRIGGPAIAIWGLFNIIFGS